MPSQLVLTAFTCLALAAAAPPQNGPGRGKVILETDGLSFPADPRPVQFAPFASVPARTAGIEVLAAGLANLDGDQMPDAWFLGRTSQGTRELVLAEARSWMLGAFRAYPGSGPLQGGFESAATWRTRALPTDTILLADPNRPTLELLFQPVAGHPNTVPLQRLAAWQTGTGVRAVATADAEQDGHDDIWLLRPEGPTPVLCKLRIQDHNGMPVLASSSLLPLPQMASRLVALDWDGDRRGDAAVEFAGLGVLVVGDSGAGLAMLDYLPTIGMAASSLKSADRDRDGRDDLLLGYPQGAILWHSQPQSVAVPLGNPVLAPPLASADFADGNGDGTIDVVGFGVDGQTLVLHAFAATGNVPVAARLRQPPAHGAVHYTGATPMGLPTLAGDLDADGDQDLLVQLAGPDRWLALMQNERTLQPTGCAVVDRGPLGETGFLWLTVQAELPPPLLQAGASELELVVFLRSKSTPGFAYWGRLIRPVDPVTHRAQFSVYLLADPKLQAQLIQGGNPYALPGGITAGGETLLSVHAKRGPQRFGSWLLHQDPGGDGNKSGLGVKWDLTAAPPAPNTNDDPLPWD